MGRRCILNANPTPQRMPASIFDENCDLDIHSVEDFCTHYGNFLDWVFSSCSHPNRNAKKNQLVRRCTKIRSWYQYQWLEPMVLIRHHQNLTEIISLLISKILTLVQVNSGVNKFKFHDHLLRDIFRGCILLVENNAQAWLFSTVLNSIVELTVLKHIVRVVLALWLCFIWVK